MVARKRKTLATADPVVEESAESVGESRGNYFIDNDTKKLDFISTGNTLLDDVLGGGLCMRRMTNLIGAPSAGKTLIAIETCCNFQKKYPYPEGIIRYVETENAFDNSYAEALGLDVEKIQFPDDPVETVEDLHDDVDALIKSLEKAKKKPKILYIVDSYDALSSEAEMSRTIRDASFGGEKAKKSSEFFRRVNSAMSEHDFCTLILSQTRAKMNVSFGQMEERSGGKALDFYATHLVWLSKLKKITKTIKGVERSIGIRIKAKCTKNKVGLPFKECEYSLVFGFGVDDALSMTEWLFSIKGNQDCLEHIGINPGNYKTTLTKYRDKHFEKYRSTCADIREVTKQELRQLESNFIPKNRKY